MTRKKRTWTVEEKLAILKEAEEQGVTSTCREYGVYQSTYYYWKKKLDAQGEEGLRPQYSKRSDKEVRDLRKENQKLKEIIAEKELELKMKGEMLKKKYQQ